jgi:hypothetical protein
LRPLLVGREAELEEIERARIRASPLLFGIKRKRLSANADGSGSEQHQKDPSGYG